MHAFPIILKKKEIKNKAYFQRGRYHFLVYNLDGSIVGNNSGLYLPPTNFLNKLEFFVFRKGKWRNLHKYLKQVKIDSFETHHYYEVNGLKIELEFFVPDNHSLLKIFIKSNKKVKIKIVPKVDFDYINKYHENPVRGYCFRVHRGNLIISSNFDDKTVLMFNLNQKFKLENKTSEIKSLQFTVKNSCINIICSYKGQRDLYEILKDSKKDIRSQKKKRYERKLNRETYFKSNNQELNELFELAKHNILLLRHRQPGIGRGFLAGIPSFMNYFGRDSFWSILGSLLLGDFENVKNCLNMFAKYQSEVSTESKKPGKIPHEIWLNGEPNYYSTDSSLLFVKSIYEYYKYTGDKDYLNEIFPTFKETVNFIVNDLEDGRINHGKLGFLKDTTWMDSYNRGKTAIEMQALVVSSLEAAAEIAKALGERELYIKWSLKKSKAKKALRKFFRNGFCIDHINKDGKRSKSITANPLFLLALKQVSKTRAKKIVNFSEKYGLFTNYGVRSRAKKSQGYKAGTYHKGGIWPFLTGVYLIGLFNYNLPGKEQVLDIFSRYFKEFSPGLAPEYIHGNNFTFQNLKHESGFLALWSSALLIQAMLQGICGIKVGKTGKLLLKPKLPKNVNEIEIKNYRFRNGIYNIKIKGKKGIIKRVAGKRV